MKRVTSFSNGIFTFQDKKMMDLTFFNARKIFPSPFFSLSHLVNLFKVHVSLLGLCLDRDTHKALCSCREMFVFGSLMFFFVFHDVIRPWKSSR